MEERDLATSRRLTRGLRKEEVWSCRILWLVCFVVLLPVAVAARLSGWRWRPWPAARASGYRSAIKEAKSMSATITGTVFSV